MGTRQSLLPVTSAVLLCAVVGHGEAPKQGGIAEVLTASSRVEFSAYDHANRERNLRWILNRERARPSNRKVRACVFADAGVWHIGAKSIVDSLEERIHHHFVLRSGCAVRR